MRSARSGMIRFTLLAASLVALDGCTSGPRPIEVIRQSADHRYRSGDFEGAQDEYAEIVARYPGDWQAHYRLGLSMLKTGEYGGARRALETAYTHKPDSQEVANALAEAMFLQGDENRLFAFLRDRASTTQSVEAYLQLARYSMELNDPDSAQTALDTAIELDKGMSTQPYLEAARLAERLGHLDDAVKRLRQAYGINPHDQRILEKLRALGEDPAKVTPLPPGR